MKKSISSFKMLCRVASSCLMAASFIGASQVLTTAAEAAPQQLRVRGALKHVHGVNMPWMVNSGGSNYGHDIGPNNFTGYGYNYVSTDVDAHFVDIKNMHTNVVRVWLFENLEGLNFNGSGQISGINSTFLTNLNNLLTRANNRGLAVELVLFNHDIGNQFGQVPASGGSAVKNFFTDTGAQTALINNVIKPLATAQKGKLAVFGYDLMNESNYAVSPFSGITASANWSQMHSWIYNVSTAIHGIESAAQVTCSTDDANSFTSGNHWNRFGGVGLNYYEYHQYSDAPNLWTVGSTGPYPTIDKPIILGEHGARTTNSQSLQETVTDSYINQSSNRGWAGNMAWSYMGNATDNYSVVNSIGNWKNAAWKIQWWGLNQFGL